MSDSGTPPTVELQQATNFNEEKPPSGIHGRIFDRILEPRPKITPPGIEPTPLGIEPSGSRPRDPERDAAFDSAKEKYLKPVLEILGQEPSVMASLQQSNQMNAIETSYNAFLAVKYPDKPLPALKPDDPRVDNRMILYGHGIRVVEVTSEEAKLFRQHTNAANEARGAVFKSIREVSQNNPAVKEAVDRTVEATGERRDYVENMLANAFVSGQAVARQKQAREQEQEGPGNLPRIDKKTGPATGR